MEEQLDKGCHDYNLNDQSHCSKDSTGATQRLSKRNVLILNDEWGTSKGGISAVHRCIAQQVKTADFDVHVTAFTATEADSRDAKEREVNLIIAKNETSNQPNFDWLNFYHSVHFPTLQQDIHDLKVIVGHVPITSKAAFNIRRDRFPNAKVFLFNHIMPQSTDMHKESWDIGSIEIKMNEIVEQAEKADAFFSVGPKIFGLFENEFRSSDTHINHKEFLPLPDEEFFNVTLKEPDQNFPAQILTVGRVAKVEYLKGYDVVADALSRVANVFDEAKASGPPAWRVRGIASDKQRESKEFLDKHVTSSHIDIIPLPYGTQQDVRNDLKKSHLFIMPSRCEPFGMVALEAMAIGLPTLVTSNSGIADFLKINFKREYRSVVVEVGVRDCEQNVDEWKKKIITILRNYSSYFDESKQLSKKLRDSPAIKASLSVFREMLEQSI
ncbi:uncharacterized protein LOC144445975 [Glandiceps talaboti]